MREILALMDRALRYDARKWGTYGARGVLVSMVLMMLLTAQQNFGSSPPGLRFFTALMWVNMIFLILISMNHFGSAIAEEKEDRTLALLRMTKLSPVAILLGKSTSRLIAILLLLLAQFPFTLLAITLGGISMGQIFAAYVALLACVVMLGNMALLASTMCSTTRNASGLTFFMIFCFFAGPWILYLFAQGLAEYDILARNGLVVEGARWLTKRAGEQSVFFRMQQVMSTGFDGAAVTLSTADQVLGNLSIGAVFFLISWASFDHLTARERPQADRGLLTRAKGKMRFAGTGRIWPLPLAWKDYNFVAGGTTWLVIKFLLYGLVVGLIYSLVPRMRPRDLDAVILFVTIPMGIVEIGVLVSRTYSLEISEQTLPVLRMLPMSQARWAYSKLIGSLIGAIPVLIWFGLGMLPNIGEVLRDIMRDTDDAIVWLLLWMVLLTYWHLCALISLWTRGAMVVAAMVILFGYFFIGFVFMMLFTITGSSPGREFGMLIMFMVSLALGGLCIAIHAAVGVRLKVLSQK